MQYIPSRTKFGLVLITKANCIYKVLFLLQITSIILHRNYKAKRRRLESTRYSESLGRTVRPCIKRAEYRKNPKYSDTPKIWCNHPKIWTRWLNQKVMHPKDAAGIANSIDPDQSSLIWVCTVCPDLPVRKLRIITVITKSVYAICEHQEQSDQFLCTLLPSGSTEWLQLHVWRIRPKKKKKMCVSHCMTKFSWGGREEIFFFFFIISTWEEWEK